MTEPDNDSAALEEFNRKVVDEFRANGGRVGGPFEGSTLLLLHTTGAKSGKSRLSPLGYMTLGDRMLIIGAYAGAPKHPAWVHNVRANPKAYIEIGTDAYDVDVRELPDDEREALYPRIVESAPRLAEYQAETERVIPVFELTRPNVPSARLSAGRAVPRWPR
ncbi:nitroreductase family deazaflavin-dependent oxidoreductase [Mycobacterium sp. ITM-2016-00317]|uniref:nitroreductase family deazaflavin-dependent oxidoreductase n=1 Tax=Mycobacterium sp. ITM-2016-00317 TaxID=2099694 RepID=UPI000D49DA9A|nr:nitroreductase family deazaflavin-dependent oxidoreductase [Mycobacterium sp. ITM-2016-00317]WNG89830.1 nitroreductase family deazaflavin-dependent oxidoreductase [Mycobacterium sp. ITM-2016-00317]